MGFDLNQVTVKGCARRGRQPVTGHNHATVTSVTVTLICPSFARLVRTTTMKDGADIAHTRDVVPRDSKRKRTELDGSVTAEETETHPDGLSELPLDILYEVSQDESIF